MKVVAINGSPRKGWNTDMLIDEAIKGAESMGAEVHKYDLYKLDSHTGCRSCFGCKTEGHEGECIVKDGLKPVLDDIKTADALIMGAPNYFSDMSAQFKLFYERLLFPYLTYNKERVCCNDHMIPVLLIMTCNAPDGMFDDMIANYSRTLSMMIGPTQTFISTETQQVNDYSKYNWTFFDGPARVERRDKVFPEHKKKVFEMGAALIQ
jgi:multimeric flavodoxin WrbA